MKTGIVPDLDLKALDQMSFVSYSKISKVLVSEWAFFSHYFMRERKERTKSMEEGVLIHEAILRPKNFLSNYKIIPEFSGKGSVALKNEWMEENKGSFLVKQEMADCILRMIMALNGHDKARNILKDGKPEVKILHKDNTSPYAEVAIIDYLRDDGTVIDLKSAASADSEDFSRSAWDYGYIVQAPFYCDVASKALGSSCKNFMWVVVEKSIPFNVSVFNCPQALMDSGRELYKLGIHRIHNIFEKVKKHGLNEFDFKSLTMEQMEIMMECFPGANNNRITDLHLPLWTISKLEDKIANLREELR